MKFHLLLCAAPLMMAASTASAETPKLHPLENLCVVYEMQGSPMKGTTTRCHRKFGYESYDLQDLSIEAGGVVQTIRKLSVSIGEESFVVDAEALTATRTINQMFAPFARAMERSSPDEISSSFLAGLGFHSDGTTQSVNLEDGQIDCEVFQSAQMGQACITEDAVLVSQDTFGIGLRAISVDRENGGDPAIYSLPERSTITEAPTWNGLNTQGLTGDN